MVRRRIQLNAVQTLAVGFAALIMLGGVLLALPLASRDGRALPFLDALFTSASASCVTGLVLYDTYTQFTLFGQAVILLLIQVGGMGFMTVSILVAILLHRRIGLRQRSILMDSVGALQMGGVVRLTRLAIRVTLTCEGVGAVLLALWFCPRYGLGRGLWMSLFHAVSSFCNAGFDLLGTGTSLSTVAGEPLPNIVLMALVICCGLGFLVWDDLLTHRWQIRRWRLHSKIVLFSTTLLFAGGAAAFYFLEKDYAFAGSSAPQRALMAAFQSVTCRTAGFNTAPLTALSQSGAADDGFDVYWRGFRFYRRRRKSEYHLRAVFERCCPSAAERGCECISPPSGHGHHSKGLLHGEHFLFGMSCGDHGHVPSRHFFGQRLV